MIILPNAAIKGGQWRPDNIFMYFNFLLCCMNSLCGIFRYTMLCVNIESVKKFLRVSLHNFRLHRHKQMLGKFLAFCGVNYETCESTEAESQLYLHIMHRPMTPPQDLRRTYWFTSPIQAPEARIYLLERIILTFIMTVKNPSFSFQACCRCFWQDIFLPL